MANTSFTISSDQNRSLIPLYLNESKKNETISMSVFQLVIDECFLLAARRH